MALTPRQFVAQLRKVRDLISFAQVAADACGGLAGFNAAETLSELATREHARARTDALLNADDDRSLIMAPSVWARLSEVARQLATREHQVAAVGRGMLVALDEAQGEKLTRAFEAREEVVPLRAGSIFPIATLDYKALLGESVTARPVNLNQPQTRLSNLGILGVPQHGVLDLLLDFRPNAALSSLLDGGTIAVIAPNVAEHEFAIDDIDLQRRRFFGVRPVDAQTQLSIASKALAVAHQQGAAVAIYPELCATEAVERRLADLFDQQTSGRLSLVIAGSRHLMLEGARANRGLILAAGAPGPRFHSKLNPFEMRDWNGARYAPPLREDLGTPGRFTVHWSRGRSFVVLICKDLLDQGVIDLLAELRINFVFVCSFSRGTTELQTELAHIAVRGQTTVVVANFAGSSPQTPVAILGTPTHQHRLALGHLPAREPTVFLADLKRRHAGWRTIRVS